MMYHNFSPIYSPYGGVFAGVFFPLIVVALVWTLILKGFALWYAARGGQKWWFVALLIINTLGILEIVYLIWFRRDTDSGTHHHDHHTPAHHSSAGA